jgi:uncharacterized protein (DUF433 family)
MLSIPKKIVTNEAMQPLAVQIDYAEWLKIEHWLNQSSQIQTMTDSLTRTIQWNAENLFKLQTPLGENAYPHITRTPDICGGEPIIEGTRTTVRTIAGYYNMGMNEEEMLNTLSHLTPVELHAALTYYLDNPVEIEGYLANHEDYVIWQQYLNESETTKHTWVAINDREITT